MNATIIHKPNVNSNVLDGLARQLPSIIAGVMQVPGGRLAIVRPENVSLVFSQASTRDTGSDIRIMIFARRNDPRTSAENDLAGEILDKVVALIAESGEKHSADIRLHLMDIGVAKHTLG